MGFVRTLRHAPRGRVFWMLALYAGLLAINPVLHDDIACHLKSPTHCSACAATPSASRVEGMGPVLPTLAEVGPVPTVERTADSAAPSLVLVGRSPPA